ARGARAPRARPQGRRRVSQCIVTPRRALPPRRRRWQPGLLLPFGSTRERRPPERGARPPARPRRAVRHRASRFARHNRPMQGQERRGRARDFLLGGLVGASPAVATARPAPPPPPRPPPP